MFSISRRIALIRFNSFTNFGLNVLCLLETQACECVCVHGDLVYAAGSCCISSSRHLLSTFAAVSPSLPPPSIPKRNFSARRTISLARQHTAFQFYILFICPYIHINDLYGISVHLFKLRRCVNS